MIFTQPNNLDFCHFALISTDDECDLYGIQMVKLQDPQLAKRYGIKTFPSLVYFRNGNPLTYDGKKRKSFKCTVLQGDHSGCAKHLVDIDVKVAFLH